MKTNPNDIEVIEPEIVEPKTIEIMTAIKILLVLLVIIVVALCWSVVKIENEKYRALDMLLKLEKRKEELKLNPHGKMKRIDVPKENTVFKGGVIVNGKLYILPEGDNFK